MKSFIFNAETAESQFIEHEVVLTDEDIASIAEEIRSQRDLLLKESDWTQLPDATVDKVLWAEYRQNLRDITSQEGFPLNTIFPTKP